MTGTLRPPPYRRRDADLGPPLDEDPAAQDARLRRELIRATVVLFVVGIVAAIVMILGYVPGGRMGFLLPPDLMFLLVAGMAVVLAARRNWKRGIGRLLLLLLGLGILSLLGILFSLFYGPSLIRH